MCDLTIIRLANYARHVTLTKSQLNEVFNCKLSQAAPVFNDPDHTSPTPYPQRLAASLYPAYFGGIENLNTEILDYTENGDRVITVAVFDAENNVIFRHTECYNASGSMTMLIVRGPAVNVAVTYKAGVLSAIMVFTATRHSWRQYQAGTLDTVSNLRKHTNGLAYGCVVKMNPRSERLGVSDDINLFEPTIYAAS